MRKKRNYAPGGYMGNPYQLATQQGVAGVQQINAKSAAGNTGSGFNLGSMAAGGLDPYSMAVTYATQTIGDYNSAFNYKPQLGPEKSQKDYNKEILMAGLKGGVVGTIPAIIRMNKDKNTIVSGSPGTYAAGGMMGDQQLSNQAFQVKGNPNTTDGNSYPQYNANLDHNEVVDQNAKFVFSDDLKMPGTKRSFAQAAKPLYKKVGDLESRKDPISSATVTQLNKQINTLAMTQEQMATMMGLRNNQSQGYDTGGPIYTVTGINNAPSMKDIDIAAFQTWYNSLPGGTKLKVDGKKGPLTEQAYKAAGNDYAKAAGLTNSTQGIVGPMSVPLPGDTQYADVVPVNGKILPSSIGQPQNYPRELLTKADYLPNTNGYSLKPTRTPTGSMIYDVNSGDPFATVVPKDGSSANFIPQASQIAPGMKALGDKYSAVNITANRGDYNQGFTAGDIMQGIEVGSKFFNIGEGPEQEGQLLNTTPITKTGYDVNPALYQNQRNYRNTVNGIGTASAPQRRALNNSLLATKLNSDNQIMSQYQNMNNEATVNYEQRLSQQRQGNIASAFRTNDMNAANRGMYDQAQQNAFTSLGNFGEALNRRKMSQASLDILRINYPDIYESVMGDLNEIKKRRSSTTIKTTT